MIGFERGARLIKGGGEGGRGGGYGVLEDIFEDISSGVCTYLRHTGGGEEGVHALLRLLLVRRLQTCLGACGKGGDGIGCIQGGVRVWRGVWSRMCKGMFDDVLLACARGCVTGAS